MKKLFILGLIVGLITLFQLFDLGQFLTLDYIKSQQASLQNFYQQNRLLTIAGFFVGYVLVTGASLPGAAIMTLAAGAVALALTPFLRPGVPVLLTSVVAVVAGVQAVRDRVGP